MKPVVRTLGLISVLLLALAALPVALADDQREGATRERPQSPRLGETAPLASVALADLEGRPIHLGVAQGKERFLVLHVFDVDDLDLVPGPDQYERDDLARASRAGGGLERARLPETWTLDDCVEQAHRRFDDEGKLSWVGVPTWGYSQRALEQERERIADGGDAPEPEALSSGRLKVLELKLKRRENYDFVFQAPSLSQLARAGVRQVPCVLILDPEGRIVFRWDRYDEDDDTNYLLRALNDVSEGEPIATPRGGPALPESTK